MQGKYSPTVSHAYYKNQQWHTALSTDGNYDDEGYDSYGYNADGVDRAGHQEHEYYSNDDLYSDLLFAWGFDGTRPVRDLSVTLHDPSAVEREFTALKEAVSIDMQSILRLRENVHMLMGTKPTPKGVPKSVLLQGLAMGMDVILKGKANAMVAPKPAIPSQSNKEPKV
jgi:hypothetical protein